MPPGRGEKKFKLKEVGKVIEPYNFNVYFNKEAVKED